MSYNEAWHNLWQGGVTISAHSWYHQCTRLDTQTGDDIITVIIMIIILIIIVIIIIIIMEDIKSKLSVFTSHITGHLTVVLNGRVLRDNIEPFFVNSTSLRPKSLKGT